MKNLLSILFVFLVLSSCEKLDDPDILGSYVNTPDYCDSSENQEFWCSRLITLSAGGVADVLYGGDIISRTSYKIKGDKIKIEKNDQFGVELMFKQLSGGSLREEGDKSIWLKLDN